MPALEDHDFVKICANLASLLNISISSARRKVDIAAAKNGITDLNSRKKLAQELLKATRVSVKKNTGLGSAENFDQLLKALGKDEHFMIED